MKLNRILLSLVLAELLIIVVATWWLGVFGSIAAIAFVPIYYYGVRHRYRDDFRPDEVHHIRAADGWDLCVWRVRPVTGTTPQPVPVLLVHGLAANQRGFELDERNSLARFLAARGYDCFVPALRGAGPSQYKGFRPGKWNIVFEDYVEKDVPAFLDLVRAQTGADRVHYVGQSMGAMIGYAVAQGPHGKRLRSFTAMAGPCFFKHMSHFKAHLKLLPLLRRLRFMPLHFFATVQAPIARRHPEWLGNTDVNGVNVEGDVVARACVNLVEPAPGPLMRQFAEWVRSGEFGSDRTRSWQAGLSEITVPIFCMGGSADFFCPPGANADVINHVGSAMKRYRLFSTAVGGMTDYGHGDLFVGRTAPDEVFPAVHDWIRDVDAASLPRRRATRGVSPAASH